MPDSLLSTLRPILIAGLAAHLLLVLAERAFAPHGREEEYRRALRLVSHGPFARAHWWIGIGAGTLLPLVLLLTAGSAPAWGVGAALALAGMLCEQDILVRAGQAPTIS